jgi:hypothetical protein
LVRPGFQFPFQCLQLTQDAGSLFSVEGRQLLAIGPTGFLSVRDEVEDGFLKVAFVCDSAVKDPQKLALLTE